MRLHEQRIIAAKDSISIRTTEAQPLGCSKAAKPQMGKLHGFNWIVSKLRAHIPKKCARFLDQNMRQIERSGLFGEPVFTEKARGKKRPVREGSADRQGVPN